MSTLTVVASTRPGRIGPEGNVGITAPLKNALDDLDEERTDNPDAFTQSADSAMLDELVRLDAALRVMRMPQPELAGTGGRW